MNSRVSTGNSRVEIDLRKTNVHLSKERQRLQKNLAVSKRKHDQMIRKLGTVQRSLLILVGQDPYPEINREDALFEFHSPGFCYRRDGSARYLRSLQESSTRRIVNDIDGREGLRADTAVNVVSDTPRMAEVLSNAEIVQILCELRNTGAILSDPILFEQFAQNLEDCAGKQNLLLGFEGPMDYLKQYRKNLIQEFFDTLKTEAEMKLLDRNDRKDLQRMRQGPEIVYRYKKNGGGGFEQEGGVEDGGLSSTGATINTARIATKDMDGIEIGTKSSYLALLNDSNWRKDGELELEDLSQEQWNQAVIESLARKEKEMDSSTLDSFYKIRTYPNLTAAQLLYRNQSKSHQNGNSNKSKAGLDSLFHPRSKQRREFDAFVKHLISKIEILDEMGRGMLAFNKKRPFNEYRDKVTNPLMKILRRPSLFASLTEEDVLYYEINRTRKEVPLPNEESFSNLNYESLNDESMSPKGLATSVLFESGEFRKGLGSVLGSHAVSEGLGLEGRKPEVSFALLEKDLNEGLGMKAERIPTPNKMKRVCCLACREKVRLACKKMQNRDKLGKAAMTDLYKWKVPEIPNWPRINPSAGGSKSRPKTIEETARDEEVSKAKSNNNSRSVYLIAPPKKGAPIPRFTRNFFPPTTDNKVKDQSGRPSRKALPKTSIPMTSSRSSKDRFMGGYKSKIAPTIGGSVLDDPRIVQVLEHVQEEEDLTSLLEEAGVLDSWTLRVSKMDIMRLRYELETEAVKDKMAKFEEQYLNTI